MQTLIGNFYQRTSSSATKFLVEPSRREISLCLGLGLLLVGSHLALRMPLHLPGHHGIIDMAILIALRQTVRQPWAASLASASAAGITFIPAMGFGHSAGLLLMMSGFIIDLGYWRVQRWQSSALFLLALAALSHGAKPIARWLIATVTDTHFGSLTQGLTYPLVSHILFGLAGGLGGILIWRFFKKSG